MSTEINDKGELIIMVFWPHYLRRTDPSFSHCREEEESERGGGRERVTYFAVFHALLFADRLSVSD